MNKMKLALKGLTLIAFLIFALPVFAQLNPSATYRLAGKISYEGNLSASMTVNEEGIATYSFTDISQNGTVNFLILSILGATQTYYGANERTPLIPETPFEAIENGSGMLYFNVITGGEYTVTFDGTNISLKAEEPENPGDGTPEKYLLAGSFMGSSDNVSFEMVQVEGSENLFTYTFENTVGILFFMIDGVINSSDNIYFGAPDAINTPLVGSYNTVSDTDSKKVGSLFFEMKEGKKYTIIFDINTNTVVLTAADATNSPLTISSFYDNASDADIVYPEFRLDFTDVATPDYLSNKVTKFEITTWDADMAKRKSIVYSYTAADEESALTLSTLLESLKQTFTYNEESGRYTDENVFTNRGEYIYIDGDYLYRLALTVIEDGHTRRYTVYSDDFTVNQDGNPLVLSAFYLIQLGNGESNYLTLIDEDHSYPYSVTDAYGQLGQSNQITFNKSDYEDGDAIDFGDETIYKFTDKVLIRSNIPFNKDEQWRIDHCELYVQEPGGTEIPVVNSINNRNVFTDGRFMAIVNLFELIDSETYPKEDKTMALTKPLEQLTYKLKIWYNPTTGDSSSESGTVDLATYEASVPLTVTLPMPRVEQNYIEAICGTINNGNEVASFPSNFEYQSAWAAGDEVGTYPLNGARFHNLRKVLVIKSPNVTLNLGQMMQDKSTGTFIYAYKYYNATGEVVKEVPFDIMSATDDDKLWTIQSAFVLPESLLSPEDGGIYAYERVTCESTFEKDYPRWTDTDIVRISLEDNPPVFTNDDKFQALNWNGRNNQSGEFVESFQVEVKLDGVNTNKLIYPSADSDSAELNLMHNQKTGTARDYFLVEIVDKTSGETLALDYNDAEAEKVMSAADLSKGQTFRFTYNHHKSETEVGENFYYKNMEVRISYLYPFNEGDFRRPEATSSESYSLKAKSPLSNLTGSVIKSQPSVFGLTTNDKTGLENITEENSVKVSGAVGAITITDGYAEIFNLNGVKVAEGEGRHLLSPGTYIVATKFKNLKITVK